MELPISDVSFPKDAFMQDNFNVDRFLQESCPKSGLHKLHKELGMYIKYLQSLMIDIVNAESNTIVSLSSDLKTVHGRFGSLSTPLGQLREEVSQIHKTIDTNLNSMESLLDRKAKIVSCKTAKLNEMRMLLSSYKIGKILRSHRNNDPIDMETLERSVDQHIMQHMYVRLFGGGGAINKDQHTRLLDRTLNEAFLRSVSTKDTDTCARCLRMYMLMNTQAEAERLYRLWIVKPLLSNTISENALSRQGGDLTCIYQTIMDFIKRDMQHVLDIVSKRQHGLYGFNFVLNSAWLEAHEQLKDNMNSIYAPGNPAVFHQRYKQTCLFLHGMAECFPDERLKNEFLHHPSYHQHKHLWNLPVYYEIRHRKIVQSLEEHLPEFVSPTLITEAASLVGPLLSDEFKLSPFVYTWRAMSQCFHPDIYLPQLLDRFWRLNLQIISRLNVWINAILKSEMPMSDPATACLESESCRNTNPDPKVMFLSYLYMDVCLFMSRLECRDPPDADAGERLRDKFVDSLAEPIQRQLPARLTDIENMIVDAVYSECSAHVKHISQIPRLYRKTNRSVPTSPSPYVTSMCAPADTFRRYYGGMLGELVSARILRSVHTNITSEYGALVENVLTSVTRTEESLKRLKKVRTNPGGGSGGMVVEGLATIAVTDDHKIRLQVQLDVAFYSERAAEFTGTPVMDTLLSLTREATPERQNDQP